MIDAPVPADEAARLAALLELRVLDTPAEERFDRITRTARALFAVPIALISLVDARRQWFKSAAGLDLRETPRGISLCGHAILGEDVFVVEDALDDPRFDDNPLVRGQPGLRFYAGMPLRARSGSKLGTLCLIDRRPRRFAADHVARLRDLAAWAEAELNRPLEIAAQTAEMRENFVRLVGHELRTPVTSLLGALALLNDGCGLAGQPARLAGIAHDSAQKLHRLIEEIVDLSRLDAGEPAPTPGRVELAPLIESVLADWQERAAKGGIAVIAELPPGLAANTVADWLGRILCVLLDNALRFSPAGSLVAVKVARRGTDTLRIAVSDAGRGIHPAHQPQMFQDFAQADAGDSREHGGLGLGLAICRRLAEAMGGRLGHEAEEGGGSRFFIDLPAT